MSLAYFLVGVGILGLFTAYSQMDDDSTQQIHNLRPAIAEKSELCLSLMRSGKVADIPPELQNHPQLIACEKIKKMNQKQLLDIYEKFAKDKNTEIKLEKVLERLREASSEKKEETKAAADEKVTKGESTEASDAIENNAEPSAPEMEAEPAKSSTSDSSSAPSEKSSSESSSDEVPSMQPAKSEEEWLSVDHTWDSSSSVDSSMTGYSDMRI